MSQLDKAYRFIECVIVVSVSSAFEDLCNGYLEQVPNCRFKLSVNNFIVLISISLSFVIIEALKNIVKVNVKRSFCNCILDFVCVHVPKQESDS